MLTHSEQPANPHCVRCATQVAHIPAYSQLVRCTKVISNDLRAQTFASCTIPLSLVAVVNDQVQHSRRTRCILAPYINMYYITIISYTELESASAAYDSDMSFTAKPTAHCSELDFSLSRWPATGEGSSLFNPHHDSSGCLLRARLKLSRGRASCVIWLLIMCMDRNHGTMLVRESWIPL